MSGFTSLAFVTSRTAALENSSTKNDGTMPPLYGLQRSSFERRPFLVAASDSGEEDEVVKQANSCCRIDALPQELMDMVVADLTTSDVAQLRASCRTLEQLLHPAFVSRTFGEVSIRLTREHLASLAEAVSHAEYASQMKALRVYSHIRTAPVSGEEATFLRDELRRLLFAMTHCTKVTVIGEDFEGTGIWKLPNTQLLRNGINCHLRLFIDALRKGGHQVSFFALENIKPRHSFRYDGEENQDITTLKSLSVTCDSLDPSRRHGAHPGGFFHPAFFVDAFKTITKLAFSGTGHQSKGSEMAQMLVEVRLPQLRSVSLSNCSVYHMDLLCFCLYHQESLEQIELTRLTLRSYCFDELIKEIIEVYPVFQGDHFDLSKLRVIRVGQVCEAWHFDRYHGGDHEEIHRSVHFNHMDNNEEGWWQRQTLEVPGRASPKYQDFFGGEEEFGRRLAHKDEGCHLPYHSFRWDDEDQYFGVDEGSRQGTLQEAEDGTGNDHEYSGADDENQSDWWEYL